MSKGFAYVVSTVTRAYEQPSLDCVPTAFGDRIFFGPCKKPMRPRVQEGDYLFGISGSTTSPRRVVFAIQVEEIVAFGEAYGRYPALRGPQGPVHVKPVSRPGSFPRSEYEHIPGSTHPNDWESDLATQSLDRFFVSHPVSGWRNRWLGAVGPCRRRRSPGGTQLLPCLRERRGACTKEPGDPDEAGCIRGAHDGPACGVA